MLLRKAGQQQQVVLERGQADRGAEPAGGRGVLLGPQRGGQLGQRRAEQLVG